MVEIPSEASSRSGTALLHLLTRPLHPADADIARDLQSTLTIDVRALLFGALSVMILIATLAYYHDRMQGFVLAVVFGFAVACRYVAMVRPSSDADKKMGWIFYSGLFYALAISLTGAVAAFSGNSALIALAALVITGLIFGFCIANSGAPFFAQTQTFIVFVPFILGASFSGPSEMLLILVQSPIWLIGIFMLVRISHLRLAGLIRAQRQSSYLAYNDMLTGLANRAQVMSSLQQIAEDRSGRSPPPYVLYLDLDGFKAVNDTYGHAMGDLLLRQVAQRLSAEVRAGDIVGRIGGDEFIILLRELDLHHIAALAERLADAIARPFALGPKIEVTIGVSIGGAPLGQNAEDSIAEADTRLYAAKNQGRGTYRLAGL